MLQLSVHIYVINSDTFASVIYTEVINEGYPTKEYEARLFDQISDETVHKMAEEIKENIILKLEQALKLLYDNDQPLLSSTYLGTPYRVFLDPEVLTKSLRIVPIARGYVISFKHVKYPKTKVYDSDVAHWLNNGTDNIPARPFFDMSQEEFESLVKKYAVSGFQNVFFVGPEYLALLEPTPDLTEIIRKLVDEIPITTTLEKPKESFVKSIISGINTILGAGKRTDKTKK